MSELFTRADELNRASYCSIKTVVLIAAAAAVPSFLTVFGKYSKFIRLEKQCLVYVKMAIKSGNKIKKSRVFAVFDIFSALQATVATSSVPGYIATRDSRYTTRFRTY